MVWASTEFIIDTPACLRTQPATVSDSGRVLPIGDSGRQPFDYAAAFGC